MESNETTHTSMSQSPSATLRLNDHVKSRDIPRWLARIRIGSGIYRDVRSRLPYYISDWTDAWNYRVIPAIVLIFFAK